MKHQYPKLPAYKDLPFDIRVVESYSKEKQGFTLTITPSDKFFNYGKTKYPNIDEVWERMSDTPHHPGVLAYARCAYEGGNVIVINNLQRDSDYDNFIDKASNISKRIEAEEAARWIDNVTKEWNVFLLNLVKAIATSKNINAFLTTFDQQKQKWGRLPIHKSKKTYQEIPEMMGFPLEESEEASKLTETRERFHDQPMYQVADNIIRIIKMGNNWYTKAQQTHRQNKYCKTDILLDFKNKWERILGLGRYKPNPSKLKKKKVTKFRDLQHSMDINEHEEDDGW
jgi:hypothetical protein